QVKDRESMSKDEFEKNRERYCGDNKLCSKMINIDYFASKFDKLTKGLTDFTRLAAMCTSDLGGFSLCPPTHKRSMYDTPEFPELRLEEETKRNFNRLLHSMTKPEL
ncbi:hypothetical protein PMAYCL1PPCAC_28506, partial [Pristionchus mayeri]